MQSVLLAVTKNSAVINNMKKQIITLTFLLITAASLLFLISGAGESTAAGNTYYVATTGSNSNSGTQSSPFQTIQKCASIASAGDTCLIRAGTYRETITPANSGTASAPITFAPYNGESVTVSGADPVSGWSSYQGSIYKSQGIELISFYSILGLQRKEATAMGT